MGREVKRVPLDFAWPLNEPYEGFINDLHDVATECSDCHGSGYSPEAKRLQDLWYGYICFRPEDRGRCPFTPSDPPIRAFAERNVARSPGFYGPYIEPNVESEALRLCILFNGQWSHHLNE